MQDHISHPYTSHLLNTQWASMDPVYGQPLCRKSVCTHFEWNIASAGQKFKPFISLSLALHNFWYSEKKNGIKSEP